MSSNRFSEDIDLSISPVLLGHNEAFLDDAPSSSKRRKRMQEIEHLCAASVEEKFKPTLELAFRKLLGAPAGQGDWLEYRLDPASKSPTLLFSYPQTASTMVSYIAQSVKIEFGSLTDQQPKGMHGKRRPLPFRFRRTCVDGRPVPDVSRRVF